MAVIKHASALLLVALSTTIWAAEVHNLRVWSSPDSTRAVLDLDETVDYRIFTLSDPERLVVDIENVTASGPLPFDEEAGGVIRRVRHGVRNGNDLRVVFDLKGPAEPQSFVLDPAGRYGHRLVIDMVPEGVTSAAERFRQVADARRNEQRDMIVAIDAGHGGEDPGAIGPGGTYEKTVNLHIARELERQIDETPGMRAVMIRTGDYFVPLRERYERARQAEADLFLSVHADAFRDSRIRGSSVFVLSRRGASSQAARLLAESHNRADLIGGVELDRGDDMLSSVLIDLSQSATMEYSDMVAESIFEQLGAVGRRHRKQVERANFVVLRSPDVPSVLLEAGFISNPDDEKLLNSPRYRKRIATAVVRGVRDHFLQAAPQGTWIAANRSGDEHIVRRGDTLGVIAQRYQVSLSTLRAVNNLDGDVIHPGAVLVIPTGT